MRPGVHAKSITVQLTPEDYAAIQQLAKGAGTRPTSIVRAWIEQQLAAPAARRGTAAS